MLKKIRTSGEALPGLVPTNRKPRDPELKKFGICYQLGQRALEIAELEALDSTPLTPKQLEGIMKLFRSSK